MTQSLETTRVRRPGAQPGNANALRHGGRARFALSRLPEDARRIENARAKLRTLLEVHTLDFHGEVTVYHACLIQTACRWETVSQLASRWLRLHPNLPIPERANLAKLTAWASEKRDLALKALGLGKGREPQSLRDYLAGLPSAPEPHHAARAPDGQEPEPAAEHVTSGPVGDDTGDTGGHHQ